MQQCVPIVTAIGNSREREILRTPHGVLLVMDVDSKVTKRIIAQTSSKQNQIGQSHSKEEFQL